MLVIVCFFPPWTGDSIDVCDVIMEGWLEGRCDLGIGGMRMYVWVRRGVAACVCPAIAGDGYRKMVFGEVDCNVMSSRYLTICEYMVDGLVMRVP